MRQLVVLVPPGIAVRRAEYNRVKGGSQAPERQEEHSLERLVAIGKRAIVREALRDTRKKGRVTHMPFQIVPPGHPGRRQEKVQRQIRYVPSGTSHE